MTSEKLYEAIGDINDKHIKEAKQVRKAKQPIWFKWGAMAACLCLVVVGLAILLQRDFNPSGVSSEENTINLKPVINFEGVVTAVEGNRVTLESGTIILITENTEFAGDPDTGNAVSKEIFVGNYIQGYTEDNIDAAEVTANKIWSNERCTSGSRKR